MLEEKDIVEQEDKVISEENPSNETETLENNQSESQQETVNQVAENKEIDELSALKTALEEQKDKYLRLFAEFDNFKKRNAKERIELFKSAGQDIMRELLPILDDFQRAQKVYEDDKNAENYTKGVQLIYEKFLKTLQNKGLKTMESIGKDFDVQQHEAVAEIPAPSEELKGKVIDEAQAGYTLNDIILRYAKVVVGK
ncbi:MAG: nucleotide exchange factor GrpE [Bacteroidetes bacterium]|nr:nucleotide exchange factor GrpE [Bacteroidota bacterium]